MAEIRSHVSPPGACSEPVTRRVKASSLEVQLELSGEQILSPLPRCVHLGQHMRGRVEKGGVVEREAGHQGRPQGE